MIHKAVKRCPRALIVLDEVDRLPSNLVDALTPFHEYETKVDGIFCVNFFDNVSIISRKLGF